MTRPGRRALPLGTAEGVYRSSLAKRLRAGWLRHQRIIGACLRAQHGEIEYHTLIESVRGALWPRWEVVWRCRGVRRDVLEHECCRARLDVGACSISTATASCLGRGRDALPMGEGCGRSRYRRLTTGARDCRLGAHCHSRCRGWRCRRGMRSYKAARPEPRGAAVSCRPSRDRGATRDVVGRQRELFGRRAGTAIPARVIVPDTRAAQATRPVSVMTRRSRPPL